MARLPFLRELLFLRLIPRFAQSSIVMSLVSEVGLILLSGLEFDDCCPASTGQLYSAGHSQTPRGSAPVLRLPPSDSSSSNLRSPRMIRMSLLISALTSSPVRPANSTDTTNLPSYRTAKKISGASSTHPPSSSHLTITFPYPPAFAATEP